MKGIVLGILRLYKQWISPCLPPCCRFEPSCSAYMYEAIEKKGMGPGMWLGLKRLLRCHPFCSGGPDPVP